MECLSRMGNEAECVTSPWPQMLRCLECVHLGLEG